MSPKFQIPHEFQNDLRYVEDEDLRTDEEILQSLLDHKPVTSEKNIWAFWHSGLCSMPEWRKRNVINWVRVCQGWTIRVLDDVPGSRTNALNWVPGGMLPESYTERRLGGAWTGQHSADFLRGPCLYLYGGVWVDVGCILIRHINSICWHQLADAESPFTVAVPRLWDYWITNSFVASRKGDPFIKHWHEIFMALWQGRSCCDGIADHPLLAEVLPQIQFGQTGSKWEYNVPRASIIDYVAQVAAWGRLCMIEEPADGFNGREYCATHVIFFDALSEGWPERLVAGMNAQSFLSVLKTRLDADPNSPEYKIAYNLVWRILTKSSLQFINRGNGITKSPQLGALLDQKGNENLDLDAGTFFELLRYGSVHFEQLREKIDTHVAQAPTVAIRKRILEP